MTVTVTETAGTTGTGTGAAMTTGTGGAATTGTGGGAGAVTTAKSARPRLQCGTSSVRTRARQSSPLQWQQEAMACHQAGTGRPLREGTQGTASRHRLRMARRHQGSTRRLRMVRHRHSRVAMVARTRPRRVAAMGPTHRHRSEE